MSDTNPLGVPARRHINPDGSIGGWVADTAYVAPTAYVGPNARVCDYAQMSGYTRMNGNTRLSGYAQMHDYAQMHGNTRLSGFARMSGYTEMRGNAQLGEATRISGFARMSGDALATEMRHILTIGPIGSESQYMTVAPHRDGLDADPVCAVGCWSGRLSELEAEVLRRAPEHAAEYAAAQTLAEIRQQNWTTA